jgi:TRAP transporter TAXI family solute receptor
MSRKVIKCFPIFIVFLIVFAITSTAFSKTKFMNISTSRLGGSWYPTGETLSRIVTKYVPDVNMNATTSSGGTENVKRLRNGDTDLGFITHNAVYEAYKGIGDFQGEPYSNLRILFNITSAHLQIVALADSNIRTIDDFKGKRIGDGSGGSAIPGALSSLLKVYGMSRKDIVAVRMGRGDRAKALGDRNLDAALFLIGKGAAVMRELTTSHDVVFIEVPPEKVKEIQKEKPYFSPGIIKKEVYPKELKTDYHCMEMPSSCCVDASMPEELAYNIVKAIWDHYEEVVKMNPYFGHYQKPETAILHTSGVPIHPGAEKYFKEKGILK